MDIRRLSAADADRIVDAADLFDDQPFPGAVQRFLSEESHHILIAYEGDAPVGFVTGVEMTHPDKGTEMFLYELGVAEEHRRRGIGTALVQSLATLAESRGCYGMWVLTDDDNAAALSAYSHAGGVRDNQLHTMLSWQFGSATTHEASA